MNNTKLWQSLRALSGREHTALQKFLASPYFNQREDVITLYEVLLRMVKKGQSAPEKEIVWNRLFPETDYRDQELRLLMSYLQKLVEQFMVVESVMEDKASCKRRIAKFWRQKGENTLQQQAMQTADRSLERSPIRNADYHFERYRLYQERYRQAYRRRPEKGEDFQPLDRIFNTAFVAMKLRQTCLLIAHAQVYEWGFTTTLLEPIYNYIEANDLLEEPCINIYWHGIQMLRYPDEEQPFREFKKTLLEYGHHFPHEEVHDLYILALNYGVRRVNDGQRSYFHDIMDFYKDGLKQEYLLRNGQLSRFTYHNIVSVALQIGQADWAEEFITNWTSRIDRRYRERMESFNRAKIAYFRQKYDEALPLLQRANYHDPLLNLSARTLLLKIYFELGEYDALQSHLDAFQTYLHRKPELGYHRANYRHLIRFTRKLLGLRPGDETMVTKLKQQIQKEEILTEREWLLGRLDS